MLASGRDDDIMAGALMIRADARLSGATLAAGDSITHRIADGMSAYLVVSAGSVTVNGVEIGPRDAAAITRETEITISASEDCRVSDRGNPDPLIPRPAAFPLPAAGHPL